MKTAVIYARYSSERQTEQSIEGQLRVCKDYAERNDLLILDTYIDRAMTGTNDNRASFQQMLKDSSKQAWDIVLVYKLDRFSRNRYESAMHKKTLKDNGIRLVSATETIADTPEGIILESLLEGMAEYYSAELSQKVRRGMNETRQKGNYTGGILLYGFKKDGKKVVIDEDKAKVIRFIYEKYASGVFVKDIIEELTASGILHKNKPFARNTIYNILKNEKYSGVYHHNGEEFANIYPRIVPEDIYTIVRQKTDEMKYGKHDSDVVYLLKNKMICGYCGKSIASETGSARNGEIKRYYKCLARKRGSNCKKAPIRKELLEKLIIDTTFKIFDNAENLSLIADLVIEKNKKRNAEQYKLNLLIKERNESEKAIDNLIQCMEKGIVTNSTKKRIEDLEKKIEDLKEQIAIERAKEKIQVSREEIMKFIRTTLKKNAGFMIKLLIDHIVLFDDKVEIYYNYVDARRRKNEDIENHKPFEVFKDNFETEIDTKQFSQAPQKLQLEINAYMK